MDLGVATRTTIVKLQVQLAFHFLVSSHLMLAAPSHHGRQFIDLSDFARFTPGPAEFPGESAFVSPEIVSQINWDELVVSWNADAARKIVLKIQARAIYSGHSTRFYTLGIWSSNAANHQRTSVKDQNDEDGEVRTDTLSMKVPCDRVQIRLISDGDHGNSRIPVKLLGLCLADTKHELSPLAPNRAAWGKSIPVPQRTQLDYPQGEQSWCSPVSTSMILAWWAEQLQRPELDSPIPNVATEVEDPNWPGTGNWPFNTAYAGSFPGIRAYVSRFSDVSELEDWIASGIPVALSVAYSALKGLPPRAGADGHLVVCVGFTQDGDVILNDPGTRRELRRTVPRANLVKAWAHSHNTVYLIYPDSKALPTDRFGHWTIQKTK